jgi:hypothetical protein
MYLRIPFDSKWGNSFLGGDNNKPLPKNGRDYIASTSNMKKNPENYIRKDVSIHTTMGILNRLIGDQRKLFQSRSEPNYFYADIEDKVTFNIADLCVSEEVARLSNGNKSSDPTASIGLVDDRHPLIEAEEAGALWAPLMADIDTLCDYISHDTTLEPFPDLTFDTLYNKLLERKAAKNVVISNKVSHAIEILQKAYPSTDYLVKDKLNSQAMYMSAVYISLNKLSETVDTDDWLTPTKVLPGLAKKTFTEKGFNAFFAKGSKKQYSNPYIQKTYGKDAVNHLLHKSSGTLEINIEIPSKKALEIKRMIENACVTSFCVGKKGVAYLDKISI